jgi:hypothetical protein
MESHVFNLFEITNLAELQTRYRLVDLDGTFGEGDLADQNLSLLAKRVAYREQAPVALVRPGGCPALAVPADLELTEREYQLTPDVVTLLPQRETHALELNKLSAETERIGISFLSIHLRTPLMRKPGLWSSGAHTYFSKRPVNYRDDRREIDVFEGFGYRLLRIGTRLFLSLWLTNKYADNRWLLDRYDENSIHALKMRHLLYHGAVRWFPVQLLGLTGKAIAEQRFVLEEDNSVANVYDYTRARAGATAPQWIRSLSPDSPAISYQYPGNEKKHFGAAALCKLLVATDDPRASRLHRLSIKPPEARFRATCELLSAHFSGVSFEGIPVRISDTPLREKPRVFAVPAVSFGQNKVLRVARSRHDAGVGLSELGSSRMSCLLDPQSGLAVHDVLGAQYMLVPQSLERKVAADYQDRLEKTVRQFLHTPYSFRPVVYDDRNAKTLKQQVDAVTAALERAEVLSGHGVLVLPANANPDLHNFLKRRLHGRLQLQCARAAKVRDFYRLEPRNGAASFSVPQERERDYVSYLRYTAMGLLLVNRQWPWVLEGGTHYDVYVGLDVLRNTAAFTFFYEGGRKCFVRLEESKQKEKVPRNKVAAVLYQHLKEDLKGAARKPRSIILRRDGRAYESEWLGFQDAVRKLVSEGVLPKDVLVGVVEVHKSFALGLRIASDTGGGELRNPRIGSYRELGTHEGIVCTTGYPFKFDGTVKPLLVGIARGSLDLLKVLEDTFALSQLCWPAPNRCMRLPIDLKLCDELLRATASEADDDEALYGEEEEEQDFSEGTDLGHPLSH